jgi:vacuolar protein sorting-associated protein 54
VADSTVLGVQSVDMDGSNYSANSVSTEKATYKAMETLPAEVFAAVIRAATHALAGHFARAEIVRSAAQYALGTVAKDGGENTSRGIVADDVRTQLCASLPPGERASASAAASDAVLALADASQGAMAKILASRASTNARLTLREFSKICDAAESFLARAESLSGGRRCLSLRGALNTQCKDFMSVRHAAHAAKLGSVLESETWTAVAPVPGEYQRILDAGFEPCVAVNSAERGAEGGADTAVHDDDDTAVRDALVLPGGERVVPVGASLALLKMCADHLAVARRVPSLGPVAVYKIAELLRVFNSRTSQLVLGAGSMRTAGLRSITAKHLALAQQSVRLFLEVTPAVSAALSPTLPDTRRTQLLSEFTSTVRDLEKHKTELQTKMVSIARDRLVYHSARLPTIWCSHIFTARKASLEEGAADLAEASSEFATALGKEVGTLRRVIAGTLSNEDATCVLNEVLRVFDEGLTAALAGSKESTANEWRAKMGSPTKPKPAVPMDDAEGGAEEGADTAVVHDDDGEETEETTVKSAAPSENEVNGLIGRDGGALLGTLGTLVNGGTGGDGACGAPTLANYLLEYRS